MFIVLRTKQICANYLFCSLIKTDNTFIIFTIFEKYRKRTVLSRNKLTLRLRFGRGSVAVRSRFGCGWVEVRSRFGCGWVAVGLRFG